MRQSIAVLLGTMVLLGSLSGASAQRDGADRGGGRLDSQEIRDDIEQDRLKRQVVPPSSQQTITPVRDPVAKPQPKKKPKPKPKVKKPN